jgi:hypothetical protein
MPNETRHFWGLDYPDLDYLALNLLRIIERPAYSAQSTLGFDGIKTVLYLFVLSHVVTQNRIPLLRNMLWEHGSWPA